MTDPTGGCACGAIRYRLMSQPFDTGWCHCRICQQVSGAPALVFTTVPRADFRIERGAEQIGTVSLIAFGQRQFARCCGSPLTIEVDWQPETVDVTAATLDDPERVRPGFHIFYERHISWAEARDGLPCTEEFRPDTRGLASGGAA